MSDAPFYESETAPVEAPLPVPDDAPASLVVPPGGSLITLPSGYRVAIRGTRAIRNREREAIFEGVDFEADNKMTMGFRILANIQRLLITAWDIRDFDDATGEPVGDVLPIPAATDDDVLGLLSMGDAQALDSEATKVQKVLLPNFEPSPDQKSPTLPSGV